MLGQNEYLKKLFKNLQKCIFLSFILFRIFKLLEVNTMMLASGNMQYPPIICMPYTFFIPVKCEKLKGLEMPIIGLNKADFHTDI